jgi:hypothetical protein
MTDGSPEMLEETARPVLERAEQIVGWITGDFLTEFAYLTGTNEKYYFRVVAPTSRRRQLLGPGNVGAALGESIQRIAAAADADERFGFALSLYRDALHERNKQFKIARLFGVLEALAYALKSGGVESRAAIRTMLGLGGGATGEIQYGGRTVKFERIELAGRLRDSNISRRSIR